MIEKELTLAADFPPVGFDQWKTSVVAELKGAPFEKRLVTRTPEGIDIQPLYTAEDWPSGNDPSGFPGFNPLTRGGRALGHAVGGWDVRQEHLHPDPAEANKAIMEDLQHGVTSIQLRLDACASAGLDADARDAAALCGRDGVMAYTVGDFETVLAQVHLDIAPVSLDAGGAYLPAAALLGALIRQRKLDPGALSFGFNADPLGALMSEGHLPVSLDVALAQMADLAAWTSKNYPQAKAVEINTSVYHHAGATSTQDLAFAVATGAEYLRAMLGAGMEIDAAIRQISFGVSLGCRFFQSIAKLRALRKMWSKVITSVGGSEAAARSTRIHVRTSRRVMTRRDPWVNLLRNTVCCFAGAVGGADSITTSPLDAAIGLSDEFSRHLARNTQTILQEESHLNRVIDPAGGSWYMERLTDQLAEKAWELFQTIEERGGMVRVATEGWVTEQIKTVQAAREKNLATRKQAVTGVSEHPNVNEQPVIRPKPDAVKLRAEASSRLVAWRRDHRCDAALKSLAGMSGDASRSPGALTESAVKAAEGGATLGQISAALVSDAGKGSAAHIEPLAIHTYAAAYEELRDASDAYAAKTGKRPQVFLANMGTPAESIARATYALNFFQAGGFEVINADGFSDPEAAAAAFRKSGAKVAVICSTDKKYETVVEATAPRLKAAGARTVILAGNPGANEAKYRAAGVDRFIFVRCDVLSMLHEQLREEGILS